MNNSLMPKETYSKISDINLIYLRDDLQIKGLIFDFDGTIFRNNTLSDETIEFMKLAKSKNLKISVLSNNVYVSNEILEKLNISTIKKLAFKPLKKPFLDMAKTMKLNPNQIAVIGNTRLSDVWGANRAGMYSIYLQNFNSFLFKRKIKGTLKNNGIKKIK